MLIGMFSFQYPVENDYSKVRYIIISFIYYKIFIANEPSDSFPIA